MYTILHRHWRKKAPHLLLDVDPDGLRHLSRISEGNPGPSVAKESEKPAFKYSESTRMDRQPFATYCSALCSAFQLHSADLSARHHLLAADRRQGRRQRLRREDALARLLHGRRVLRASRLLLLADLARSRICKTAARTTNLHKISQEWTLATTNSHSLNLLRYKAAAEMKPAHAPLLRLRRLGLLHSPAQGQKKSAAIPRGDPTIHHSQAKRCNSCPPRPAWRVQIPNILDSSGFHETPFD